MPKKSKKKKIKYLENEKSLLDERKSIFHHFGRTIIEGNSTFFFGKSEFDFNYLLRHTSIYFDYFIYDNQ